MLLSIPSRSIKAIFASFLLLNADARGMTPEQDDQLHGTNLFKSDAAAQRRGLAEKATKAPGGSTKAPVAVSTKTPTVTKTSKSATLSPSVSQNPSSQPSDSPSASPSSIPSLLPSLSPSASPSSEPSVSPSESPSARPSSEPSLSPSERPSSSSEPSLSPSESPSTSPSSEPSLSPSKNPSFQPSLSPSKSSMPSFSPSVSSSPTDMPSSMPSECDAELLTDAEIKSILSAVSDGTGALMDIEDTPQNKAFKYIRDFPFDLDSCSAVSDWQQRFALAVLYHSITNDPANLLNRWVPEPPFANECTWSYGVSCSYDGKSVTGISFGDFHLEGTIPSEIGTLSALTLLELKGNPDLVKNNLEVVGDLSAVQYLSLNRNEMTSLPSQLSQLVNLVSLDVSDNSITNLPIELGQLINLTGLSMHTNSLTSLPTELGQLVNLERLDVRSNDASLAVPLQICNLLTENGGKLEALQCDAGEDLDCCN